MAIPVVATLGGLFSVAYSIRFVWDTFLGDEPEDYPGHPHDPSFGFWLPPAVLVVISILGGVIPQTIAEPTLQFASTAAIAGTSALEVLPKAYAKKGIYLWHGFNIPLLMSAIAVVGGSIFFAARWRVIDFHNQLPDLEGRRVFRGLVAAAVDLSRTITDNLATGSLQRYIAFVLSAALVGGALPFAFHQFELGQRALVPIDALSVVGWLVAVGATLFAAVRHRQRMSALISVGVVGLMLSLTFVHFSGPDLAMTQLSVEVVAVLIMLLALFALPETTPKETPPLQRARDIGLAVLVGGGTAFLAYAVMTRGYDRMADQLLAASYPLGNGTNVVNVILVDFRGFDTMGEISVLAIAALGIYSMLVGERPASPQPRPPARERFPMILSHVARPLMALILAAAVYIFLRGHNEPGGGFIAGLVATVALVIQYVAHGRRWADNRMRTNFRAMAIIGVLIAVGSGVAAWAFEAAFLTQEKVYWQIPLVGKTKIVSTVVFDLGVFLTVVGAVMSKLIRLGTFNRVDSPNPVDTEPLYEEEANPWKP
jgi:multicomponent K+:H+ antiporter subunit A